MEEHLGTGDISLVIKLCKYIEDVDMDDNFQLALWITVAVLMMLNMFVDALSRCPHTPRLAIHL